MKEERDFSTIYKINSHFDDLYNDIQGIESFEDFVNLKEKRRAILFDYLQIGELLNQLSKHFLASFNNKNAYNIISIRNRIVHGYSSVRDNIIYNTLKSELPHFIDELNVFAKKRYQEESLKFLGRKIRVLIDRPKGSIHKGLVYPIDYGYTESLSALDGEFQDVYVIDGEGESTVEGTVIAIVVRNNDIENKLVVSKSNKPLSKEEIDSYISFQEKYFEYTIITSL